MKTCFTFFGIFLGIFINSHLYAGKKANIAMASQPPMIDGVKESIWDEAFVYELPYNYSGIIDNPGDFSARWYALWDTVNIYFLAEIKDDALKNSGPNAAKFWIHDCFEIFFDMLNEKNEIQTGDSPTDDKYQYRFIYGLDDEPIYENPPVTGMQNVSKATAEGYIIEIKLPWATLIGTHSFGDVIIGRSIGAEFQAADLDNSPQIWMPDANLLWNNPTGDALKLSSNFGTLILVADNLPDTTSPGAVDDLSATAVQAIEAVLSWTSPGDDLHTGLAEAYAFRYSTELITEENWEQALPIDVSVLPLIAGTGQNTRVEGLSGNTSYYFAMKTQDETGNWSILSNVTYLVTPEADTVAPAHIIDFSIKKERSSSIELQWTAPGDDSITGKALIYELRYSETEINESNWDQADMAAIMPAPDTSGTLQSVVITGLKPETTYYFAIKTTDEQENKSPISNIALGTTLVSLSDLKTPMDQFIGTNAFIDDPLDKMKVAGFIREYHSWDWDAGSVAFPNNRVALNSSYVTGWYFDSYYKKLLDAGITVSPCILGSTKWLSAPGASYPYDGKPIPSGLDPEDPHSYKAHADHMFQFAARYGSQEIPDNLLKLATNQNRVSGLGYLKYLENWNEPDRTWGPPQNHFDAAEFAAMGSADRDGHEGTMGMNFGVKNADPEMKLVMGGLADSKVSYIEDIRQWCLKNRTDKTFVYDVINIHHYTLTQSPEQGNLKEMVKEIADYRDQYLPDVEVWITEFGWDSGIPNTPFSCPSIGSFSKEEVQAQWMVRSFLLLSSTGINRAAQFMLRNVKNNGTTQFDNCGLVNEKNDWKAKTSWYYTYTLRNVLKGKYFAAELESGDDKVRIYTYKNTNQDTTVYAVWAPTSEETTISSYTLRLPPVVQSALQTELITGSTQGITSELELKRNTVTIAVTERPVFVITSNNPAVPVEETGLSAKWVVFPNPVTDILSLKCHMEKPEQGYIFRISDLTGRTIKLERIQVKTGHFEWQTDMSGLTSGIYFIEIFGNNQAMVKLIRKN